MVKIGVVGGGSWGTTIANHMALKGINVDLWVREEDVYSQIKEKRINETFLPGITLSKAIRPVQSLKEVSREKDFYVSLSLLIFSEISSLSYLLCLLRRHP